MHNDRDATPVEFWQSRYQKKSTSWNLGTVAPPFVSLWETQKESFPIGKLVALGCGYGHDPAFFGKQGFDALGLDYAPTAIQEAQALYGEWTCFREADIFNLPSNLVAQFDYVLEHACFCAIPIERRKDYIQAVLQLLKPNGIFIGLFITEFDGNGPPWVVSSEELKILFQPFFELELLDIPKDSIEPKGKELLCVFRRK